jgi:hypothetical protein
MLMDTRAVSVACIALATAAGALGADEKSLKDRLDEFTTDLSMPASPAAAHVGLSAESVVMPRNRREFEAGISNAFKGTSKPTGALEFAPYYIFRGGKLSVPEYRTDSVHRALTKTTIGVASGTRKIDDAEISAKGLSVSTVLVDLGDPIYSHALQRCINEVQNAMLERAKTAPVGDGSLLPDKDESARLGDDQQFKDDKAVAEYKACVARREPQLWNRSRVSVGIAAGRGREDAAPSRRIKFGTGVWVTAQYGFESLAVLRRVLWSDSGYYDCATVSAGGACSRPHEQSRWEERAMVTVHARRTDGASDLDLSQSGELPRLDSTLLGARLTYGSQTRSVFLEASRNSLKGEAINKRTSQHAFGASFRVSENLWVNAVSGRRKQYANGKLEDSVELNLQYGFASEPLVKPR